MSVSLAALATLGSLMATGIGAAESAGANEEARSRLAADREADRQYYDRLLSRDYISRPENESLLRRLQELQRKNYDRARAVNTVAGGTDASIAALQAQGNDVVGRVAEGIASQASTYRDKIEEAKRASGRAYAKQMFALDQARANAIATAAGQATKAMAGIAAAAGDSDNPFGRTVGESDKAASTGVSESQADPFGLIEKNNNQVSAPESSSGLSGLDEWKKRLGII